MISSHVDKTHQYATKVGAAKLFGRKWWHDVLCNHWCLCIFLYFAAPSELSYTPCIYGPFLCLCPCQSFCGEGKTTNHVVPLFILLLLFFQCYWNDEFNWFIQVQDIYAWFTSIFFLIYIFFNVVQLYCNIFAWSHYCSYQEKWCCKCTTFCMPYYIMIEIVIFITGRGCFHNYLD